MNDIYCTAPAGGGKGSSAPHNLKYVFDLAKMCSLRRRGLPTRPLVLGFLSHDGKHTCVDGDRVQLAEILDKLHRAGRTLSGTTSTVMTSRSCGPCSPGEDPYPISTALSPTTGPGLPPELRDRGGAGPRSAPTTSTWPPGRG